MASGSSGSDDGSTTDEQAQKGDQKGQQHGAQKGDKVLPPAAKRKKKGGGRVAPSPEPGTTSAGGRYTAPIPAERKGPSPVWVPVLMFGLWGLGLAVILLNYMGVLPGTDDGGNGFYLVGGLVLILGGIITATQYR